MRPPIDSYGTLDFGKFDEIYNAGYMYAKQYLKELKESSRQKGFTGLWGEKEAKGASTGTGKEKVFKRAKAERRASI